MNELQTLINDLENAFQDLKDNLYKQKNWASGPNLIVGCGALLTLASIFTMPRWTSVVLVAVLSGYSIYDRTNASSSINSKVDKIKTIFDKINDKIIEQRSQVQNIVRSEEQKKDETISFLKSTIERLKAAIANNDKQPTNPEEKNPTQAELNLNVLLREIQKLDVDVEDFGDECAKYMRKEFAKTLRICGYEFVEYAEENKSAFDTETTAINSVDCTAKAIVTLSLPRKVVLRGYAFIPETI